MMQGTNNNNNNSIRVEVLNKFENETPQVLGCVDLNLSSKIENIFKDVQALFDEPSNVLEEMEIFLVGKDEINLNPYKEKTLRDIGISCSPNLLHKLNVQLPKQKMTLSVQGGMEDDLLMLGASASPTSAEFYNNDQPPLTSDDYGLAVRSEEFQSKGEFDNNDTVSSFKAENEFGTSTRPYTVDTTRSTRFNIDFDDKKYGYNKYDPVAALSREDYGSSSKTSTLDTIKYVGLVNQAMTCYLNSLLQALYMTPEFRNALYNWEFDGQNESRSIPFQLQKLFLNLQTSPKSAVETTDLTTSFGWQGSDAWQQHDIQELCRVMFDALEQKFKDTKQANLINDLYEGKMLDYVRCLECCTEKSREDTFLDIPLPVRPFGSQVAYNSVEEALRAFVQPETLDGNNQYFCEKCDKKCNAHKGLKFTKFPYLLTLHLKRFDFDYSTLHRIKLNDKVVFSEVLNLNSFIQNNNSNDCEDHIEDKEIATKYDDCCTTDSGSALEDEGCQSVGASSTNNGQDVNCSESDEGIDVSSGNNHTIEAKGPYIYDLFSIMIHSGSATGGHYYAYIKDFEKLQWYCFNDQSVTRITEDDIRKTYGGNPHRGYYSGVYSSSTNAYMLMYRQIDKDRNTKAMSTDEFPLHIRNLQKYMREREEKDRKIKEKEDDIVKITVFCLHPIEKRMLDARIPIFIDNTLEETVEYTAYQRFKLEDIVAKEDCRLVKYNKSQDCIECSFDSDKIKFCDIANELDLSQCEWFLEIRQPSTQWQLYKQGAVNMMVYPVNLQLEDLEEPTVIRVNANETVGELKQNLSLLLNRPSESLEVVMDKCGQREFFRSDDEIVHFEYKNMAYRLYVACISDEVTDKNTFCSNFHKLIGRFSFVVALTVNIPPVDIGTLDMMSIPSLDTNQNFERLDMASGDRNSPNLRISPQPQQGATAICCDGFGDQSNSEDSSLSDSDRTLVGDAPGEGMGMSSNSSNSPADQHMVSPTDPAEDNYIYDVLGNPAEEMHWDDDETEDRACNNFYFKVVKVLNQEVTDTRPFSTQCRVLVDKRMTLGSFKKHLEPYVKVPVEYFKVFRHYPTLSMPSDDEWSDLNDTMRQMKDESILNIRLGRVLRKNEFNIKVNLLRPNHQEPISFLLEHIVAKGQTVGQVMRDIIFLAKKRHLVELDYHRCRLREKSWKNAKKIYLENQVFGEDIPLTGSSAEAIFLQELDDVEKVTSASQTVFFVRRWRPSVLQLDPIQEVIVNSNEMEELKTNISQLSGIPLENCEVALVKDSIPADLHRLGINVDLDWKSKAVSFEEWPINASDGSIFFYRDNREPLKEMTAEEQKEFHLQENKRLGLINSIKNYSPGKERALKIYLDTSPNKKHVNSTD